MPLPLQSASSQPGNSLLLSAKACSDQLSTSTDSPCPESPTTNKSKIDVKFGADGQVAFNARQRRTLRRALQRQRELQLGDSAGFSADGAVTAEERRIAVDVVQSHIGRPLPENTDVDQLVKMLMSLGNADGCEA